jgi:hypothetical protein
MIALGRPVLQYLFCSNLFHDDHTVLFLFLSVFYRVHAVPYLSLLLVLYDPCLFVCLVLLPCSVPLLYLQSPIFSIPCLFCVLPFSFVLFLSCPVQFFFLAFLNRNIFLCLVSQSVVRHVLLLILSCSMTYLPSCYALSLPCPPCLCLEK